MKASTLLFSLLSLAPMAATAERTLFVEPLDNQTVEYERGGAYVTSRSKSTTVILLPTADSRSLATLRFTVFNGSDSNFTVYENAVSAEIAGKSIKILGASELEKKEKRKRFWENVGAGLAAGANSYAAAQQGQSTSTSYHTGTVSAYTPNGVVQGTYQGTTTTHTYDPQANQQAVSEANRNNAQLLSNLRAEQAARSSSLESAVLRTQTVRPGDSYSGFVQMKLPGTSRGEASMVEVSFSAGSDTHRFYLFVDGQPSSAQRAQIRGQSGPQIAIDNSRLAEPASDGTYSNRPSAQARVERESERSGWTVEVVGRVSLNHPGFSGDSNL